MAIQTDGGIRRDGVGDLVNQLEALTESGLPAAATAGRLRYLTDGPRGIHHDTGQAWAKTVPRVNPYDFGAIGDGIADDTTAIQNAIAALRAEGGGVLELVGDFRSTSQIVTQNGPNGAPIWVTGHAASPTNDSADGPSRVIVDHDGHGFVHRGIGGGRFSHISIIDNLSAAARTQGAGLLLSRDISGGDDGNVAYTLEDVFTKGFQDGIRSVRAVASKIENCRVDSPERDGIRLETTTGGSGTSVRIDNCFVRRAGQDNYSIDGHTYCSLVNCASDEATRDGYRLYDAGNINPAGHSLRGCGGEQNGRHGIHLEGPDLTAVDIVGGLMTGSAGDGIHVASANGLRIGGVKLTNNTGWGISLQVGGSVILEANHYIANTAGEVENPENALQLQRTAQDGIILPSGGRMNIRDAFFRMAERGKPPGRSAGEADLFMEDNGSGKTQLVIRWDDNVETVIATQP